MISLAEWVAKALPGNWTVTPFPEDWGRLGAYLREEQSQATLILGESQQPSDRNKNLLSVTGDYPRDSSGQPIRSITHAIKVSGNKTGSQIAADIERRLLPKYLPQLERELAALARYGAYESKTAKIAQQIADLVRVKRPPKETTVIFYDSPYLIFQSTLSKAEVVGEDDVELTLRLDSRTALKLLNLIIHGK